MSDRKYQQRGYRSEDRPERRPGAAREGFGAKPDASPRPSAPQPAHSRDAPRGRGLGAPTEDAFRCARCGEPAPIGSLGLESRCARCGSDLHTCSNCVAFDSGARFECRKEIPARVSPKDKANRCELFEARTRREFAQEKAKPAPGAAGRSAFDALFKN